MNTKFVMSKRIKYVTRDGESVRILCLDGPDPAGPIIALLPGRLGTSQYSSNGISVGVYPSITREMLMECASVRGGVIMSTATYKGLKKCSRK